VSNYILEKSHIPFVDDLETGERRQCAPVFALMSRQPGIGARWIDEHSAETYRDDDVVVGGFRRRAPRYYEKRTFKDDEAAILRLRERRRHANMKSQIRNPDEWLKKNDPERRKAAGKIWKAHRALRRKGEL